MLVPGSLVQSQSSLESSFKIEEDGEELEVHYAKELPDTFKDGAEVLVEGSYHADGYFDAQQLMAKCPSKYESTDVYNSEEYKARYGPSEGTN
jgi:cytochrome c-type biogenesis protein CcmE